MNVGRTKARIAFAFLSASLLLAAGGAIAVTASAPSSKNRAVSVDPLLWAKAALADRNYGLAERILQDQGAGPSPSHEADVLLGRALLGRGRLTEAIRHFGVALKTDPNCLEAIRGLGASYLRMSQPDLAFVYLRRATELAPKDPEVWKDLALAYRERGDMAQALSSLQQSLALDRDQADLTALLSDLATNLQGPAGERPAAGKIRPGDPFNPRPIDPSSVAPTPRVPDPSQHFPKPAWRDR